MRVARSFDRDDRPGVSVLARHPAVALAADRSNHLIDDARCRGPAVPPAALPVRGENPAMGKASIWAQWSIIVTGLVLSPVILLFTAGVLGWSLASRVT